MAMAEMLKRFFTVLEAATYASVSETKVRRWLKQGLRHIKHGPNNSAIRIRHEDLEEFLGRHTRQADQKVGQDIVSA
jgi:excisionase family DNA binding protein